MGTYLVTGIVQKVTIEKTSIEYPDIKLDDIIGQLKHELNIDCYNHSEDTEYYWNIKPEMLEGNLAEFLDTQFQMYKVLKDNNMQEAITKLTGITDGEEIIKLALSKTLVNFRMIDNITKYIKVVRNNGLTQYIMVDYSVMSYLMEGKVITEGCNNSLRYFEHNIRLQRNKYPIVDCVKVMITE